MPAVGVPEPVTTEVPTPYASTGEAASAAIACSSRSLVTVMRVPVAPSESSWARTRAATTGRSPESMRTPPSPVPATRIAVSTPRSMS